MRLAVVLAVLLSACAMTPRDHALVAVAASEVVATSGEVIQREMNDDFAAAGGVNATADAVAKLDAHWSPVLDTYRGATKALDAYEAAIRKADKSGDASLLAGPAEQVLGVWSQLQTLGEQIGFALPAPPRALVKLVGGGR